MGKIRLLPLLALVAVCLVVLKSAGLIFTGGYVLTGSAPASAQNTAQQAADTQASQAAKPENGAKSEPPPSQAAAGEAKAAAAESTSDAAEAATKKAGSGDQADTTDKQASSQNAAPSGAELEVLKSLSQRRQALDKRARDLQLRENLLKAAEQRVSARIAELKAIEKRIETELKKSDKARDAEYAKLVTLYSKMKPKKAAKIFDRLEIGVLTDLVRRMKPRTISAIFAAMTPSVAERVTMEIARQEETQAPDTQSLPKIAGDTPG